MKKVLYSSLIRGRGAELELQRMEEDSSEACLHNFLNIPVRKDSCLYDS